jgi:hypothetical protein
MRSVVMVVPNGALVVYYAHRYGSYAPCAIDPIGCDCGCGWPPNPKAAVPTRAEHSNVKGAFDVHFNYASTGCLT